jgi:hypothetical protein
LQRWELLTFAAASQSLVEPRACGRVVGPRFERWQSGKLSLDNSGSIRSMAMKTITIKTGGMYGEATIPIDRISAVGTMDKIQRSEVSPTGFLLVDGEKFFISAEDVKRIKAAME